MNFKNYLLVFTSLTALVSSQPNAQAQEIYGCRQVAKELESQLKGRTFGEEDIGPLQRQMSFEIRIVGPNHASSMDFRSDRLDILVDEQGLVAAAFCG